MYEVRTVEVSKRVKGFVCKVVDMRDRPFTHLGTLCVHYSSRTGFCTANWVRDTEVMSTDWFLPTGTTVTIDGVATAALLLVRSIVEDSRYVGLHVRY